MKQSLLIVGILMSLPSALCAEGKKYALLVGINNYDHARLPKLSYAVADAAELANVLKKHGYEITLLTDETGKKDPALTPVKANVDKVFASILSKFQRGDTILIAWSGHGLQFGKECYFCLRDTKPFETQTQTMLSLSTVYQQLDQADAGVKLVLIDACRDNGGSGIRGGTDNTPQPPKGIGVLMGCNDGEKASEAEEIKHGVFFYQVIKGLKGEAKNSKNVVTWDSLRTYVKEEVPSQAAKLLKRKQNPKAIGDLSGTPPILLSLSEVRFREPKKGEETILVPYVPTPQIVVDEMLKLAAVKEGDVVYDLGCGDGRIVVTAVVKYKAKRGFGIDLNPERIKDSKETAKKYGVEKLVKFEQGDVLHITDVSEANVVSLYMFREVNRRLAPVFKKTLKPGSRIVSHDFDMGEWKPEKEVTVKDEDGRIHTIYLWTIPPAKK